MALPESRSPEDERLYRQPSAPTAWSKFRARRRTVLGEIVTLVVVAVVVLVGARLTFQDYQVDGRSMIPTLHNGERVVVDKVTYDFASPSRGDIIVFKLPYRPQETYIKRIIGIPGDRVQIYGDKVWVNGRALYETYISAPPDYTMKSIPGTHGTDIVPPHDYFVLGDNRNVSNDSHIWGIVPRGDIIGRAIFAYWPLSQFGILTDPSTSPPAKASH